MTGIGAQIVALLGAAALAAGGVLGADGDDAPGRPTALVVDAALARDGRQLVDDRLRGAADQLRVARSAAEARIDVRYLLASGHRLIVAGPESAAAAAGLPAERAASVAGAVASARR
jgi:hypothetical protein